MADSSRVPRILVVDDDDDLREFLCMVLVGAGYAVETAGDGSQALDRIQASRPDLVLLDLMMPVMDGRGVLERLSHRGLSPPVIVVSAVADPRLRPAIPESGVSAWLSKPVDVKDLLIQCARVLSAPIRAPRGVVPR